ncbi:cystatin-like [Bufo bufo]|uniref:cystatin-like n=1 Tax=Bufo bufo TaxID=8384 RepID=UPI001ABE7351|nr:cystatin-like [Bufo bufo]
MAQLWMMAAALLCLAAVTQASTLLGGREKARADSAGVKQALAFALYQYNKGSNDEFEARVVKVHNVETQLVSGVLYFMDVDIGRTQCKKPTADVKSCKLHTDPAFVKVSTCHVEVLKVPWKSITEVKKFECH